MVRRVILGSVVASALVATIVVVQGCQTGNGDWGHDCPWGAEDTTCCRCYLPEFCVDGKPGREVPEWCDDVDGGRTRADECSARARNQQFLPSWCWDIGVAVGADGGADSGMTSLCANGVCVPPAPDAWKHVAFFMAWPNEPPACPQEAPLVEFEGSPAPPDRSCPACSCDEPEGTCNLPTTWTVSSAECNAPGGVKTNFDPPSGGWDGTCTDTSAIALGKLCGGEPCVRSITISPPVIEEKPCTPHTEGEADLPVLKAWNDGPATPIGRACTSNEPLPSCSGKGCVATNSSFGACLLRYGEHACPEGWSGERHILYGQIEDSRECTSCGCDAPTGGVCQVKWRTFSTSDCSVENEASDVYAGGFPDCADYNMPGDALAGKRAEITAYTKGACMPTGGELVGELTVDKQATICCYSALM